MNEETYTALHAHREHLIKEHGFLVDYVFPVSEEGDWDIHTHGLVENFKHPEIQICIGLPKKIAHPMLHEMVRRIKEGDRFEHEHVDHEIAEGYPAYFIQVNPQLIRMIVPDVTGSYLENELTGPYKQQYHAHPEQFAAAH